MRRRLRPATFPLHRHSVAQLAIDAVLVAASYFLAYRLRFDNWEVPPRFQDLFEATLPWVVVLALVIFTLSRLEQKQWRYSGQRDFLAIFQAVAFTTVAIAGAVALLHPVTWQPGARVVAVTIPTGVLALFFLLALVLVGGAGFVARRDARRVLIGGAGDGGRLVLREMLRNPSLALNPVGFVDDDPLKRGMRIDGVKVLG